MGAPFLYIVYLLQDSPFPLYFPLVKPYSAPTSYSDFRQPACIGIYRVYTDLSKIIQNRHFASKESINSLHIFPFSAKIKENDLNQ